MRKLTSALVCVLLTFVCGTSRSFGDQADALNASAAAVIEQNNAIANRALVIPIKQYVDANPAFDLYYRISIAPNVPASVKTDANDLMNIACASNASGFTALGQGDTLFSTGNTEFNAGDIDFFAGNYTTATLHYLIAKNNYAIAAGKFEIARLYYQLAKDATLELKAIITMYNVP